MSRHYEEYSDEKLADLIKTGSTKTGQAAFAEIYRRYGRKVYAFILRMLKNNETSAGDIFQDTMVSFYQFMGEKAPECAKAVLFTIARNRVLNYLRLTKHHRELEYSEEIESRECRNTISKDLDYKELLKESLDCLEPEVKEIFILKYYLDYTYEEMTGITGLANNKLRQLVYRASEKIRELVKPHIEDFIFEQKERQN